MVAVIVLIDQFIWRPVNCMAEKFKDGSKVEKARPPQLPGCSICSSVSRGVALFRKSGRLVPFANRLIHYFAPRHQVRAGIGRVRNRAVFIALASRRKSQSSGRIGLRRRALLS